MMYLAAKKAAVFGMAMLVFAWWHRRLASILPTRGNSLCLPAAQSFLIPAVVPFRKQAYQNEVSRLRHSIVLWGKRANATTTPSQARELLDLLKKRYDKDDSNAPEKDWAKTRSYLYRAQDKLSAHQVQEVAQFLDQIVPPATSAMILQTTPRILRKPVDSFLKPTAAFLQNLWGPELFQEALFRNPQLLLSSGVGYTQSQSKADEAIEGLLSDIAGLSATAVSQLKTSSPFVFGLPKDKVEDVLGYLSEILSFLPEKGARRMDDEGEDRLNTSLKTRAILAKIVTAYPNLLNLSIETNLQPRISFLQEHCGFNQTEIAKLIKSSAGSVLGLSVEQNLKPTVDYLDQVLTMGQTSSPPNGTVLNTNEEDMVDQTEPKAALRKCLLAHPQLLALSISNLESKVQYFQSIEDNVLSKSKKESSLAARVIHRCPAVYSLSLTENIMPTVEFLSKIWGFSQETQQLQVQAKLNSNRTDVKSLSKRRSAIASAGSLANQIFEYPTILTLSLEGNIQPTVGFFNKTGYTLLTDDWELVPGNFTRIRGRYIAASLYNRLLPRWHFYLSSKTATPDTAGMDPALLTEKTIDVSATVTQAKPAKSSPPLHLLATASDVKFCKELKLNPESYQEFKKNAIPRLKFSSQFDTWLKTGRPIDL